MAKIKESNTGRIRNACQELEKALGNFEKETSEELRKRQQGQIEEIKRQLREIRSQIHYLS